MPSELLAPLQALHRPGASIQKVQRELIPLSSPAGVFSTRTLTDDPRTTHPLELYFEDASEVYECRDWFNRMFGALTPFWVPSYQQDMVPLETIAADATSFDIQSIRYTDLYWPLLSRRVLAFVREDGTFVKREIVGATDNGDDTETIEINEALGTAFTQHRANGICFLWFGRLLDDAFPIEWESADRASVSLTMIELLDPPMGGSGEFPGPFPNCPASARIATGADGHNSGATAAVENSTPTTAVWRYEESTAFSLGNWQWTERDVTVAIGTGLPLTEAIGALRFFTAGLSGVTAGSTSIARMIVPGLEPNHDYRLEYELRKEGDAGDFLGTVSVDVTSDAGGNVVIEATYTSVYEGIAMSDIWHFWGFRLVDADLPVCIEEETS